MHRSVLALLILFAGIGTAPAEIHRWVGADGTVHFGERPPPDVDSRQLELEIIEPTRDPELAERRQRQKRLMDVMDAEQREREAAREGERQRKAAMQRNCEIARKRLEQYRQAGYLYDEGPNGGRRILSESERSASTASAEAEVAKRCR